MTWLLAPKTYRFPCCSHCRRRVRATPLALASGLCTYCRRRDLLPGPAPPRSARPAKGYDIVIYHRASGLWEGSNGRRCIVGATAAEVCMVLSPTTLTPEEWTEGQPASWPSN